MEKIRSLWDKVPSAMQVIIYSGVSVLLGQGITDLAKIQSWFVPYAIAILTVGVNLVAYLILRQNNG